MKLSKANKKKRNGKALAEVGAARIKRSKANGADKLDGAVERSREKRRLPVDAEASELAAMGKELAAVVGHREAKEAEKKAEMADFREEIDGLKKKETELAEGIRTSTRLEEVECITYLLRDQSVQVVRTDTGEVVETRAAKRDELQEEAFGAQPETAGPKPFTEEASTP